MPSAELETGNPKLDTDLKTIAQDIVARAMAGGATAAECVVREGDEFSTLVRLGQVETLKESGSKSIGVRVFFGQRAASTYSSDFSRAGLDRAEADGAMRDPEIKATLRDATETAHALGVFGVPTVAVGDELFWGDDRLEDAAACAVSVGPAA